jgi:hypothetical protein
MDISALVEKFLASEHGQSAQAALTQAGVSDDQINDVLHSSLAAGVEHVEQAHKDGGGLLGNHAGSSFFAAFASGLIKGDGVLGSLEDGAVGVLIGRIAQALQDKLGMDSTAANAAAAATAPYVLSFLRQHIGG